MKSFVIQTAKAVLWVLGAILLAALAVVAWLSFYYSDTKALVAFSSVISAFYWFWLFMYVESIKFPVVISPRRMARLKQGDGVKLFMPGSVRMKFEKQPYTSSTYMVIIGKSDYEFSWSKMVFIVDGTNLVDNPALVNLFNYNKQAGEKFMEIIGSERLFGTGLITMEYIQKHYDGVTSRYAA